MTGEPLLAMRGIVKQFPGVRALDGVDLDVAAGEVHCLLGQNGAGKSTLIKVLAGAHRPDAGEIRWDGRLVTFGSPHAADVTGIATIYQELDLVPGLSVAENVFLGHERARLGFTRPRELDDETRALLRRLGHPEIPPGRELGRLSAAGQQVVSMARALSRDARLIVMDEPSAVLDPEEVDNLFRVVRELTAEGVAVVYISHRLEEIRRIGDRVTVLKDGRTVARNLPAPQTPTAEVIRLMTGRSIEYVFPDRGHRPRPGEEAAGRVGACGGARRDGAGARGAQEPGPAHERAGVSQRLAPGPGPLRPCRFPQRRGRARGRRRGHDAARRASARPDAPGAHAVGRQPAEGGARALAAGGVLHPAARRAHPWRGRRGAQRDLRADPQARGTRGGGTAGVERGTGGARPGRPRAGRAGGAGRARGTGDGAGRGTGARPRHGGPRPGRESPVTANDRQAETVVTPPVPPAAE